MASRRACCFPIVVRALLTPSCSNIHNFAISLPNAMKSAGHTVNWYRLSCTKNSEITATRSLDIRKIKGVSQVSGHSVYIYRVRHK